jgi:hypothetical protein
VPRFRNTKKHTRDLGFVVWIAADATAMFHLVGPDGSVYPCEKTQGMLLASLHAGGARIVSDGQECPEDIRRQSRAKQRCKQRALRLGPLPDV